MISSDRTSTLPWPCLFIMLGGRAPENAETLLESLEQNLKAVRFHDLDEGPSPSLLKAPVSLRDAAQWAGHVWRRLLAADCSSLGRERHALLRSITESRLSEDDAARLVTALDYLHRLVLNIRRTESSAPRTQPTVPTTYNEKMQGVYRRIGVLANSDLPVLICGEPGTEADRHARLIHDLRGLPESEFAVISCDAGEFRADRRRGETLEEFAGEFRFSTLYLKDLNGADESFQRLVYRRLVADLPNPPTFGIVVSCLRSETWATSFPDLLPELEAFLGVSRIDVPPLRSRNEDFPPLSRHLAARKNAPDPWPRLSPEARHVLERHQWPGNVDEFEMTLEYLAQVKPTGDIAVDDLPESFLSSRQSMKELSVVLSEIGLHSGFRVLTDDDKRRTVEDFFHDGRGRPFSAADFQRATGMGRETCRRVLGDLVEKGVLVGISGASGARVTRYQLTNRYAFGHRQDSSQY